MKYDPSKHTVIIGVIHASWCGHCQNFMPHWNIVTKEITKQNTHIWLQNISHNELNSVKGKEFMKDHNIEASGYPTVFKVSNNVTSYYNGDRGNLENIKNWILSKTNKVIQGGITYKKIPKQDNYTFARFHIPFFQKGLKTKRSRRRNKSMRRRSLKKKGGCGCRKTKKLFGWF